MSLVVREDIGPLHCKVNVTITPEDYKNKFEAELIKYRKDGQIKGFRKGKTPLNLVKKMYGRAVMVEVINDTITDALNKFHWNKSKAADALNISRKTLQRKMKRLGLG